MAEQNASTKAPEARYTAEKILAYRQWAPRLFSFRTTRHRGFRFAPGQFARVGLARGDEKPIWRAYSIVSAPYEEHLEFYSIVVPDGAFSPQLARLREGDQVLIEKANYGFLTADRFAPGRDLWMLATGTGLAPFLSILSDLQPWHDFENLILVHSVRQANELAYQHEIGALRDHPLVGPHASRLRYLPVVTREAVEGALTRRITSMIEDGELESAAGLPFSEASSRFMVCGNPQMVSDTRQLLQARGFRVSRRNDPAHMVLENTW